MTEISPLRRRMIEDMTVRNLSPTTQRSYIHAVKKFSEFFERSPAKLSTEDVHAYQLHLVSKGAAWVAQPGRLRIALLLQGHARTGANPRTRPLRAPAEEAAGRAGSG